MLGPVFLHEMRAAGRKRRYPLLRVVVGLLLLLAMGLCYMAAREFSTGDRAGLSITERSQLTANFFYSFASMTILGVLAATPAAAAGAIASERERRTIEYLFATELSNAEIVLDKVVARLLVVAQIVLATLPLLALFRLLGGLPGDLLLLHFASLASTALCAASISLLVSTWCDKTREAVPRAYSMLLFWLVAPGLLAFLNMAVVMPYLPILGEWLTVPIQNMLAAVNPFFVMGYVWGTATGPLGVDLNRGAIYGMIVGHMLIAAGCLGACVYSVRRVHLRQAGSFEKPTAPRGRGSAPRTPYRDRPMLWKEMFAASSTTRKKRFRNHVGAVLLALILGGVSFWVFLDALLKGLENMAESYFGWAAFVLGAFGSIMLLAVGSRAAGLITYEKERETWLSLLTTPLKAEEIVSAKLLGNLYIYRWGAAGLLAILGLGVVLHPVSVWLIPLTAFTLFFTGMVATMVGLHASLKVKSSVKSIGVTMVVLVLMGGAYLPFVGMFAAVAGAGELITLMLAPCVPFLLAGPIVLQFDHNVPGEVLGALVMGVVGYAVLAGILYTSAVQRFDELCERGSEVDATGEPQRPRVSGEPITSSSR